MYLNTHFNTSLCFIVFICETEKTKALYTSVLTPTLTSFINLGKLHDLSVPEHLHLQRRSWRLNAQPAVTAQHIIILQYFVSASRIHPSSLIFKT